MKRPAPSLRNSELPGQRLHETSTSRSPSLSTSANSRSHENRILISGIRAADSSANLPVPSLSHSRVTPPSLVMLLPGPQSASTRSRSPSASTSPASRSPTLSGICGRCVRVTSVKRPLPCAEEHPALRLIGRADDDVDVAVAVQIARLDHARQIGSGTQNLLGRLDEPRAGPAVEEHLIRLGRARRRIIAAVGKQQIGPAVVVEIGDLDLVGPVLRVADRRRGDVDPERRGCLLLARAGRCDGDERASRTPGPERRRTMTSWTHSEPVALDSDERLDGCDQFVRQIPVKPPPCARSGLPPPLPPNFAASCFSIAPASTVACRTARDHDLRRCRTR